MKSVETIVQLSQVFSEPTDASNVLVARSDATTTSRYELQCRVAATVEALEAHPNVTQWLLFCDNLLEFAVGFCAVTLTGRDLLLLPNNRPGTISRAATNACGLLTDSLHPTDALPTLRPDGREPSDEPCSRRFASVPGHIHLLTSGSTGEPTRVTKTLVQLEREIATLEHLWGQHLGNTTTFSTVTPQHIYGLLFAVLWPLCAGRPFFARRITMPHELPALATQHSPATLVSSPAHLKRMPDLLSLQDIKPHCRFVFSSGGPLPASTAARFVSSFGQPPMEVLGSTETGGVAYRQQHDDAQNIWTALPEVEIRIDTKAEGELEIRSPFAQPGDPEWIGMGDAARPIDATRFMLVGRLNRLIKIEEKRLSLDDMEQRLREHAWVGDCSIVPLQPEAEVSRQRLGALIVPAEAADVPSTPDLRRQIADQLREHLAATFEPVLLPRAWRIVSAIPTDARGKRPLRELQARFGDTPQHSRHEPLVEVVEQDDQHIVLQGQVTDDLLCLQGHFPGTPVVAGVVQLHWAMHWAQQHLHAPTTISDMKAVKFQKLMLPGHTFTATIQHDHERCQVRFRFDDGDIVYSSGRLLYPDTMS